ncbi:MAG: ATP-binding protein [Leptospirales bacterium]|nr:ATP-binding protein [Leptospirales bacterium]
MKYIRFGETDFSEIKDAISAIAVIRAGEDPDSKYQEIKTRLATLIQQDPHFYSVRGGEFQDFLKLDDVDYLFASTGTKICLFYFSLIYQSAANDVVLWDEPENGLHPTRRYKLLDLMLGDTRQFILATHSTELARIFDDRVSVIRTESEHRKIEKRNYISFRPTRDRIAAFKLADELGLSPSRLLFTATVTIWVEGPSDMIFWRHMLGIHPKKDRFVEGFDYSFLMYGGQCISHVTALETNEKLDVMAISSHPIFIIDSDLTDEQHFASPHSNIKGAAKRIYESFSKADPGSNLFLISRGREMENYLPLEAIRHAVGGVCTTLSATELDEINRNDDWKRTEKYSEMLSRKFTQAGLGAKNADGIFRPKCISRWGENNKTDVVRNALEWPQLSLQTLKYQGQSDVDDIVEFILKWQA